MKRLVVYANPTYDVMGDKVRPGGPGLYAAVGAAALGYRVRVYGAVGGDGHAAIKAYVDSGVGFEKLEFHVDERTTRFRIEYVGDERRMEVLEMGPRLSIVEPRDPRIVSPVLGEIPRHYLRELLEGAYVDVQGFVRVRQPGPLRLARGACNGLPWDSGPRALHGDVNELMVCFDAGSAAALSAALRGLAERGVEVLASMGYRGLLLYTRREVYHVDAWGPRAQDPTGMGDVLLAAYAAAREEGYTPVDAARVAVVACGFRAEGKEAKQSDVEEHLHEVRVRRLAPGSDEELLGGQG